MTQMQIIALAAGIVLGSMALLSVIIVWYRHQKFGGGGSSLSLVGIVLVGTSIWSSIKVDLGDGTLVLERQVDELRASVSEISDASRTVTGEVEKLAGSVAATQREFVALTSTLVQRNSLPAADADRFSTAVRSTPKVDNKLLRDAYKKFPGTKPIDP